MDNNEEGYTISKEDIWSSRVLYTVCNPPRVLTISPAAAVFSMQRHNVNASLL
jgi:hypothetical protein